MALKTAQVESVSFAYDRDGMHRLYGELERVFEHLGVDVFSERGKVNLPTLYAMYDDLYEAGAASLAAAART